MEDPLSVVAICPRGLEVIVSNELTCLLSHIKPKITKGGVFFIATAEEVCMLNLWARTPTRLLIVLARTQIKSARELYNCSFKIQWKNCTNTFANWHNLSSFYILQKSRHNSRAEIFALRNYLFDILKQ